MCDVTSTVPTESEAGCHDYHASTLSMDTAFFVSGVTNFK